MFALPVVLVGVGEMWVGFVKGGKTREGVVEVNALADGFS